MQRTAYQYYLKSKCNVKVIFTSCFDCKLSENSYLFRKVPKLLNPIDWYCIVGSFPLRYLLVCCFNY